MRYAKALLAAIVLSLFGCQNTSDPTVPVCDEWTTVLTPLPTFIGKTTVYVLYPLTACGHTHDAPNPHYRGP